MSFLEAERRRLAGRPAGGSPAGSSVYSLQYIASESGLAGMVFGTIVTVVSAIVLILKSVGKVFRST